MPTVKELIESVVKISNDADSNSSSKETEAIKKANKVDRLRKLCKMGRKICFVVHTPGTETGRKFHCVSMIDAEVKKTEAGNYTITGVDMELTLTKMVENNCDIPRRVMFSKIDDKNKVFRTYRIDRIVDGTILFD